MNVDVRAYPIVLFWSDEDEAWIADAVDLKYCSAHGETAEEALREIQAAMSVWTEIFIEDGRALPPPSRPPFLISSDQSRAEGSQRR